MSRNLALDIKPCLGGYSVQGLELVRVRETGGPGLVWGKPLGYESTVRCANSHLHVPLTETALQHDLPQEGGSASDGHQPDDVPSDGRCQLSAQTIVSGERSFGFSADADDAFLGGMGDVGNRIRALRERTGLSQRKFADAVRSCDPTLKVNGAHITKIEGGRDKIAPKLLAAISEFTGADMFWIATGRHAPSEGVHKSDPPAMIDALAEALLDDAGLAEVRDLASEKPAQDLLMEIWRLHRTNARLASTHVRRTSHKSTG